jgi:hypothetical protein
VLHFRKVEQQRKAPKESEASKPARYNKGRPSTNNYDSISKHVNSIDSDGYGPPENWEKFFGPYSPITDNEALTPKKTCTTKEEVVQARDEVMDKAQANHYIACIMRMIQITGQKIVPSMWKPKER